MIRSRPRRRICDIVDKFQYGGGVYWNMMNNAVGGGIFVHHGDTNSGTTATQTVNQHHNNGNNRFYHLIRSVHRLVKTDNICSLCTPLSFLLQKQKKVTTTNFSNVQHICYFTTYDSSNRGKSKRQSNYELSGKRIVSDPFVTLGIVRTDTLQYTSVKKTFLKIAMKYHPDTTANCTDQEREQNKELFVSARMAFESIIAGPDGIAILKTEAEDYVEEDDDFEEWFKSETGYDIPFMDAATMKEVAEMTDTVGGGLDRDGGMWTLARMVTNTVKSGGDARSVLQLEAGVIRDRAIDGILRRRRKR